MPRVLVIAYEYPPSGGGGVQRIAKFTRYLPEFGWDPVVVAARPVKGRALDESLAEEVSHVPVTRVPARHVGMAVSRGLGVARGARDRLRGSGRPGGEVAMTDAQAAAVDTVAAGTRRPGRTQQITQWVSSPDFAGYWIRHAVTAAVREGRANRVDAVIASSPPFSALVAGARTATRLGVPFVADFRDAWRDNPGAWYPTGWHRERSFALERAVLGEAAGVTCVSSPIEREVLEMGGHNTVVLPNGFDSADLVPWRPSADAPPTIAFMGWLYPAHSDPRPFLEAMRLAADRSAAAAELRFRIIGPSPGFAVAAVEQMGLQDRVDFLGYQPHGTALELLSTADAGLVLIRDVPESKGSYTGKIFEYLGMGIPILLAGPPDGVAADLIREANAGWVVAHGDTQGLASALVELAEAKSAGRRPEAPNAEVIARFDRRAQAGVLARMLDEVSGR
jgi:glycosyltransferase involved in cell wall biosynthesis